MMIYTSYFAKYTSKCGDLNKAIAITRYKPKWWQGDWMPSLAPSPELLNWWKSLSKEQQQATGYIVEYTYRFINETLKPLEPNISKIASNLEGKVLLCYENLDKDFCHREVVASWFETHGFKCEELEYEEKE